MTTLENCLDTMLARLRDAVYSDAALTVFPAILRFDAVPVDGAYVHITAEPDEGTIVNDEGGEFVCCEVRVGVRIVCDVDDYAADSFADARAAIWRTMQDTAALVAGGVAPVIIFQGEAPASVDNSRLVADFRARVVLGAWYYNETQEA